MFLLVAGGCALFSQEAATLKAVGKSQDQIARYVQKQEKLFAKLLDDFENERLVAGTSRSVIIKRYGEPILSKKSAQPPYGEIFLYRHPTGYFDSDKLYLRFDELDKLIGWKYKPYKSEELTP